MEMEKKMGKDVFDEILALAEEEKEELEEEEEEEEEEEMNKSEIWDCQSCLYDSYELNSFKRQLESAISFSSSRSTRSMDSVAHVPKAASRIPKQFRKLLRTVFMAKTKLKGLEEPPSSPFTGVYYGRYLETIPEEKIEHHESETSGDEEEIKSNCTFRRSASERWFAGRRAGMMCR